MYPSSTSSSSSQGSMGLNSTTSAAATADGGGLTRYGSAPGSFLTTAADSYLGATREFSQLGPARNLGREEPGKANPAAIGLRRAYPFGGQGEGVESSSPSLLRHSSSPAGFLNQVAAAAVAGDPGFSITRGIGNCNNASKGGLSRLNSQLSFTRQDPTLSHISEEHEMSSSENGDTKSAHSYGFSMGTSWDESTSAIMFSMASDKRPKNIVNTDQYGSSAHDSMENQFQFSMAQGGLEMDKLMHIPQDSIPCKVRAKRGCATHPRSIAERERRTRISGKLKKLQILVPNMDKQTSYSDMLDLAVEHIKTLQNEVQKLHQELEHCTCGCKANDF